jgi:hypothetical protein
MWARKIPKIFEIVDSLRCRKSADSLEVSRSQIRKFPRNVSTNLKSQHFLQLDRANGTHLAQNLASFWQNNLKYGPRFVCPSLSIYNYKEINNVFPDLRKPKVYKRIGTSNPKSANYKTRFGP